MNTKSTIRAAVAGAMVALLLGAIPTAGQQADADPRLERIRAELPAEAAQQIEARIQAARGAGLPVEPLLDKAVEGMAKQVPGLRIAGAVDVLAGELGSAQALLAGGAPPTATDVAAVADAMRRGVPESAIERIAGGAAPGEPVAQAVHTLGDLMDRGVPVEQAVAVLEAWRGRGAARDALRELPAAVERLIRQGVLPAQAAAAVANAMRGGPPDVGGQVPGGAAAGMGILQGGPPIPPGAAPPIERGADRGPPGNQGPPGGGG